MKRLQFEMNTEKIKEIEELMVLGGARTKKDFINAALTLLKWAMNERRKGRIIVSMNEEQDTYKEMIMPILSDVKVKE